MARLLGLLVLVLTVHLCCTAIKVIDLDAAFDSSDLLRPNLKLDHITIYNLPTKLLSITVRLNLKHFIPELIGRWFVDGEPLLNFNSPWPYGMEKSCKYLSYQTLLCEFILTSDPGTNLETLATKSLRLEIGRFLTKFDKPLEKNRDIAWLQIKLTGSELRLYLNKTNRIFKFDELKYNINEHNGQNLRYSANFSFSEISTSTIDSVDVTFEGFRLLSDPTEYQVLSATCNQVKCTEFTDFIKIFDRRNPFDKNYERRQNVFFLLTNEIVENYQGVVNVVVHTTNIMNIKITETFDITSTVYDNLDDSTKLSDAWITDLDFTSTNHNNMGIIRCRGIGDDVALNLDGYNASPYEIIRSRYITTAYFVIPLTEESQGKYVCKTENGKSSSPQKTINLKCKPRDIAERGKQLCYTT